MSYTYKYPRPAVTADMIVLTDEPEPKILLIQRGGEPFKGCWAFPGGFMDIDETTEECARRELKEETGLEVGEVKQVGAPLLWLTLLTYLRHFQLLASTMLPKPNGGPSMLSLHWHSITLRYCAMRSLIARILVSATSALITLSGIPYD